MTENKRIVLNIAATYGRSLFALACGVFGGRWALMSLGQVDYGLHGLIGGLTAFISFLNDVMATSLSRFYALAVGQARITGSDGLEECRRWFSLAVLIHTVLPICLLAIGWPIGEWAIRSFLTIPPERVDACVWVFRFCCVGSLVGMVSVPFGAMYGAKQYIAELTVYGFASSALNITMLYYMVTHPGFWLVKYALWLTVLGVVPTLIIAVRSVSLFPECRFRAAYCLDWARFMQLLGFAFWHGFGAFTTMLRTNGIAVIINKFFGPAVNAALAVARNLAGKADELASAMLGAFTPAVTSAYGAGDMRRARSLADRMCKFGVLGSLVFMVPVSVDIPYLMRLWLVDPPEFATPFCVMVMLQRMINKLTKGHALLIQATGRIGLYEFVVASLGFVMLVVTLLLVKFGVGPLSICYSLVGFAILYAGIRPFFVRAYLGVPIGGWFVKVLVPIVGTAAVSCLAGLAVRTLVHEGFVGFVVAAAVGETALCLLSWRFVLEREERTLIMTKAAAVLRKTCLIKGDT